MIDSTTNFKDFFPIFQKKTDLIYFDNANTSQICLPAWQVLSEYYLEHKTNLGRANYFLAQITEEKFEKARHIIANFLDVKFKEIVFGHSSTELLNHLAWNLEKYFLQKESLEKLKDSLKKPKAVLVSQFEHHANWLVWQNLAKNLNYKFIVLPLNKQKKLSFFQAWLKKCIQKYDIQICALTQVSNVLGWILPVKSLIKVFRKYTQALIVLDGSQAVAHLKISLKKLKPDFYVFSGHKTYAAGGVGVLYARYKYLQKFKTFFLGGGIIASNYNNFKKPLTIKNLKPLPERLEAGTLPIGEILSLAASLQWLEKNFTQIEAKEKALTIHLFKKLSQINNLTILGFEDIKLSKEVFTDSFLKKVLKNQICLFSFYINNLSSLDLGEFLSNQRICLRVGKMCAHPLLKSLHLESVCRLSLAPFNTFAEIDFLVEKIHEAQIFFNSA